MYENVPFLSFDHTIYLKGIAILFVVISHIGNYSGYTWFTPLGGIGVSIFLFCSAFGLMRSYKKNGLRDFWRKKFYGIYIPFFLVEVIAALLLKVSVQEFLMDILFIKPINPNGWYMQYLLLCYILFYFGMRYIGNANIRKMVWVVCAVISFFACGNLRAEQSISFLLGIYAEEHHDKLKLTQPRKAFYCGVGLMAVSIIFLAIKQVPSVRMCSPLIITFLNLILKSSFMLATVIITGQITVCRTIVHFFGNISYALYLIHGHFMWIIYESFTGSYLINSCLMVSISTLLSCVLYLTVMRKKGKVT